MKVVWTRTARARLDHVHDFIARKAPDRGKAFCERLVKGSEQLAEHPYSGKLISEDGAFRQLVVEGYRLIYRVDEASVYAMTVIAPRELTEIEVDLDK